MKRARRKTAYRLALDGGELLLKVADARSLAPWRRLSASNARRALACATRLARAGVATPAPVAIGERRSAGFLVESYELVPWLADAVDLGRARLDRLATPSERRAIARDLGALVRAMHEAGVDQEDLAPNNFLWRRDGAPSLLAVDFERARVRERVPDAARHAALAKLDRYCAGESAASRMCFLRAYARGDRAAAHRLWRSIEVASAALWRRDVARWTGIAEGGGRRFARFAAAEGRVRRDVDAARVLAALGGETTSQWRVFRPAVARADAMRCFGTALALHQRGLAPRPDGLLVRGDAVAIAYACESALACGSPSVLVDRLLALGALDETRLHGGVVRMASGAIALVDPSAIGSDGAIGAGRRAHARRLAAAIQVDALR